MLCKYVPSFSANNYGLYFKSSTETLKFPEPTFVKPVPYALRALRPANRHHHLIR